MIVPDASVVLELLLATTAAERIAERVLRVEETLHAPHLLDVEVAQVLRRYEIRGEISATRAEAALSLLPLFPITRYPHEPLLARIWELRRNITAYEAVYIALAEALGAVFFTRDARVVRSAPPGAAVELL